MTSWIVENYIEIFAVVGGIYTAARAFVAMTPTPKDDAKVAEVGKFLMLVAKAIGLDWKQGRVKKKGFL